MRCVEMIIPQIFQILLAEPQHTHRAMAVNVQIRIQYQMPYYFPDEKNRFPNELFSKNTVFFNCTYSA